MKLVNRIWKAVASGAMAAITIMLLGGLLALYVESFLIGWNFVSNLFQGY